MEKEEKNTNVNTFGGQTPKPIVENEIIDIEAMLEGVNNLINTVHSNLENILPNFRTPMPRQTAAEPPTAHSNNNHRNYTGRRVYGGNRQRRQTPSVTNEIDREIERINQFCLRIEGNLNSIGDQLSIEQDVNLTQNTSDSSMVTSERENTDIIDLSDSPPQRRGRRRVGVRAADLVSESNAQEVIDLSTPRQQVGRVSRRNNNNRVQDTVIIVPDETNRVDNTSSNTVTNNDFSSPSNSNDNSNTSCSSSVLICAVCMDSYVNRKPTSTKCGHIFCEPCIRQSISFYNKCPVCKTKLTTKMLHRVYF